MKRFWFCLLLSTFCIFHCCANVRIDSLLRVLDRDIEHSDSYVEIRESRLNKLKAKASTLPIWSTARFELNKQLYAGYKTYSSDSAFYYLQQNLEIANEIKDRGRELAVRFEQSSMLSSVGMYMEAKEMLDKISRASIPDSLLRSYYGCYKYVYTEAGVASPRNNLFSSRYREIGKIYRDSLLRIVPPQSDTYLSELQVQAQDNGELAKALYYNDQRLSMTTLEEPLFALVAYNRYGILQSMGRDDEALSYLILSAISDVRLATKEQASILRLAELLYSKGDLDRAYAYINYSWQLTASYKTRMRSWNHIAPYSMINKRFQEVINSQNRKLQIYLALITLLAALLGTAFVYIYRQMKALNIAKKGLQEMNERLYSINNELKVVNTNLRSVNQELVESNKIKEVYISHFFQLCSTYVDRLDAYRKLVNKKLLRKEIAELLKITSPTNDLLTSEVQELYADFDTAFLHLFPDFVKSVNELLLPEEQLIVKEGVMLNAELRILALIRLGINKSSQIAELLHYSPTTIYNYRTRLREKAATSRDDFEEQVAKIR